MQARNRQARPTVARIAPDMLRVPPPPAGAPAEPRDHRAMSQHPSALSAPAVPAVPSGVGAQDAGPTAISLVTRLDEQDGSLVTEYGLLAVVAATLAGAVIAWASGGALVTLFNALLRQARALVGA